MAGPGTVLTVDKSGDDVVLSWTGSGTAYDGVRATDAPFTLATTQFLGSAGTSHTYSGAVTNSRTLEFFDVTDETESNRGGNWNGGALAPLPPAIDAGNPSTNIGALYIGSTGVIAGSGFSAIPETNTICFDGGVCTQATSATAGQIEFVTPPGAYSGPVTVTVGAHISDPADAVVALEDPMSGWSSISQFTFSRQNSSYWIRGTANSVTSLFRVFFDDATQKWEREERGGALASSTFGCSAQTGPSGRIFCHGSGGFDAKTRFVDTNPPSSLSNCLDLQPTIPGLLIAVGPSAADPSNNIAYFATSEDGGPNRIRKVSGDCSTELDDNYGNFVTMFGANNNSMVVDPVNGDLYFADDGEITRITTVESVTVVRSGLPTNTRLASLSREGAGDPGTLLLISGGAIEALALDNIAAAPIPVATATGSTNARFGAQVSGGAWLDDNVNRTVAVYRDGTELLLDDHPVVDVTLSGPFQVRISSPDTEEQLPLGQVRIRPSTFGDSTFSHAVASLKYTDGLARNTCAKIGDPGPGVPQYDPSPSPPVQPDCNKPRGDASGICDNVDDIVASGAGSFVDGGGLVSCKTCGGSSACSFDFRITNRNGGDNYKVFFSGDQSAGLYATTSDIYTAWKHVHVERERMCNVGGLLFRDYGATGACGGGGQPACCGTGGEPPCNQILVYEETPAVLAMGQAVVVFDESDPYETAGYTRTITAPPTSNGDGSITVTLDMALPRSYRASTEHLPGMVPHVPDFVNEHSGGLCVEASGFVEADLTDLRQAYDQAVVDYHIPLYGVDGAGVVPRLWPAFLDLDPATGRPCAARRFSQVWYSKFADAGTILGCPDPPANPAFENNVVQVIPAFDTISAAAPSGFSAFEAAFSYVFDDQIAQDCGGTSGGCVGGEQDNMRRWTSGHEVGHLFNVNKCTPPAFHDTRDAWCGGSGGACVVAPAMDQIRIMNGGISTSDLDMRADGTDHFCREDLAEGDPACGGSPREGAIRTLEDPR